MSKQVREDVLGRLREALAPLGYRQRSREFFWRDLNKEARGLIALMPNENHGRSPLVNINPTVCVRHHAIEKLHDEIMQQEPGPVAWKPAWDSFALGAPLVRLRPHHDSSPEALFGWDFIEGTDHTSTLRDLVTAIETFACPFMDSHASLQAIAAALQEGRYTDRRTASLRGPIAYYLLGDYNRALALLDDPDNPAPPAPKAKLRRKIEQAAGRPITEEVPPTEPSAPPPASPPAPQPREIRHRETGTVLLRLEEGIEFRADLRGVDLSGADLTGVSALGADFRRANLRGALLDRAELQGLDIRDTNLTGASLRGVKLSIGNAHRVDLSGADLREAQISAVYFRRAKLVGADLRGATLAQTDLTQANLRGADLRGASCPNSDFNGADLRDAKLEGIDLGSAESGGKSRYNAKTRWPEGFDPEAHGATSEHANPIVWRL